MRQPLFIFVYCPQNLQLIIPVTVATEKKEFSKLTLNKTLVVLCEIIIPAKAPK